MKVLLDEDVPVPLISIIRQLIKRHEVRHVYDLNWSGKSDVDVLKDARAARFGLFLTNNFAQFNSPSECAAIRRSGLHHVTYDLPVNGVRGLGLAAGAICAAILPLIEELETAPAQRIVRIKALSAPTKRYEVSDPSVVPPSAYW